jgi:hypothetical protein
MSVIKHEFGLTKRQTARRFRKLLSLDALHDANVRANPIPYLERASERIFQLEKTLFEAAQAAEAPSGEPASGEPPSPETIEVDKAEYERLLNCRSIVEKGLAQLGSGEEGIWRRG